MTPEAAAALLSDRLEESDLGRFTVRVEGRRLLILSYAPTYALSLAERQAVAALVPHGWVVDTDRASVVHSRGKRAEWSLGLIPQADAWAKRERRNEKRNRGEVPQEE